MHCSFCFSCRLSRPRCCGTQVCFRSTLTAAPLDPLLLLRAILGWSSNAGWILGQLVPVLQRGTQHSRVLTDSEHRLMDNAWAISRDDIMDQVAGLWCDALPMLICAEWPAARRGITGGASCRAFIATCLHSLAAYADSSLKQLLGVGGFHAAGCSFSPLQ